ncbi:unnamed protein product [marine sediment metagenome]|uniref:Uncharacterized protein n=1 Tax=marine sediment metagenome TaxID=412755 RepID=X0V4T8_9ZZZZ
MEIGGLLLLRPEPFGDLPPGGGGLLEGFGGGLLAANRQMDRLIQGGEVLETARRALGTKVPDRFSRPRIAYRHLDPKSEIPHPWLPLEGPLGYNPCIGGC